MDTTATGASPSSIGKLQAMVDFATIETSLGRWFKPSDEMNNFSFCGRHIGKDVHKLGTGKITNLAPPHCLHPFHVEVFKEKVVIAICESVSKFKEPIATLIHNSLMNATYNQSGFLPAIRELYLAGKFLLSKLQFDHCLTIVQRAFNLFSVRRSEEGFQAKVEACHVTGHDLIVLVDLLLHNEVEPKIIEVVSLDCYRLDVGWNFSGLAELVEIALNPDSITTKKFPARLFEREAGILLDFLESWRTCTNLALEIAKEQLIGFVDALNNILNGLGANKIPMFVPVKLLQLGQVPHQFKLVDSLASQAIVTTMKSNAMVVDQTSNINLLMQVLILFASIHLELVGSYHVSPTLQSPIYQSGQSVFRPSTPHKVLVSGSLTV